MKKLILICGLALVGFTSCKKKDTSPSPTTPSTTSPIVTDSMTMIVGTWHLKKSYMKIYDVNNQKLLADELYLNSNPNYNKVIFTNSPNSYASGYYDCSVLFNQNCSDIIQDFSAHYKISNGILFYSSQGVEIITLTSNSLVLKIGGSSNGTGYYYEYDKSGTNTPSAKDQLLVGSWHLDSVDFSGVMINNSSNYIMTISTTKESSLSCGQSYPIQHTDKKFVNSDPNSNYNTSQLTSIMINSFAYIGDECLLGASSYFLEKQFGTLYLTSNNNLVYKNKVDGNSYFFSK